MHKPRSHGEINGENPILADTDDRGVGTLAVARNKINVTA